MPLQINEPHTVDSTTMTGYKRGKIKIKIKSLYYLFPLKSNNNVYPYACYSYQRAWYDVSFEQLNIETKALCITGDASQLYLGNVERPAPKDDEILVKVRLSTILQQCTW